MGIRHSVEVELEGQSEASVLGLCALRKHDLVPGGVTQLEVKVLISVTYTLTMGKVREWLQRGTQNTDRGCFERAITSHDVSVIK